MISECLQIFNVAIHRECPSEVNQCYHFSFSEMMNEGVERLNCLHDLIIYRKSVTVFLVRDSS